MDSGSRSAAGVSELSGRACKEAWEWQERKGEA